jgi:hypothetical protein
MDSANVNSKKAQFAQAQRTNAARLSSILVDELKEFYKASEIELPHLSKQFVKLSVESTEEYTNLRTKAENRVKTDLEFFAKKNAQTEERQQATLTTQNLEHQEIQALTEELDYKKLMIALKAGTLTPPAQKKLSFLLVKRSGSSSSSV